MANINRQLDNLRIEIQREKATVNAIKRQLKRLNGEEVIYSSWESDANRIETEAFANPSDSYALENVLPLFQGRLRERLDKRRRTEGRAVQPLPAHPLRLVQDAEVRRPGAKEKPKAQETSTTLLTPSRRCPPRRRNPPGAPK